MKKNWRQHVDAALTDLQAAAGTKSEEAALAHLEDAIANLEKAQEILEEGGTA